MVESDAQATARAEQLRERALHRLAASMNYWIATTRPDGRPHTAPVWGVWLDGALYFGTRGQKSRNLEAQPYAIAHIDSSDDVAMVAGPVTPVDDREGIRRIKVAQHEKYGVEVTDDPGPFRFYRLQPVEGWAWLDSTSVKVDARAGLRVHFRSRRPHGAIRAEHRTAARRRPSHSTLGGR